MNDQDELLQSIWQTQAQPEMELDMAKIEMRARELGRQISRRNRREWIAASMVGVVFSLFAVMDIYLGSHPLRVVGSSVVVAGSAFVSWVLHHKGRVDEIDAALTLDGAAFGAALKGQLDKQARLLERAWAWYVMPLFVGLALLDLGKSFDDGKTVGEWLFSWGYIHGATLFFVFVALLNLIAAYGLRREARELAARI